MCKKLTALVLVFSFLFTMTSCNQQNNAPLPTSDLPLFNAVRDASGAHFDTDLEGFKEKFNSVSEIQITGFTTPIELYGDYLSYDKSIIATFENQEYTDLRLYINEEGYLTDVNIYLKEKNRFDQLLRGSVACFDFGEEEDVMQQIYQTISKAKTNLEWELIIVNNIVVSCNATDNKIMSPVEVSISPSVKKNY